MDDIAVEIYCCDKCSNFTMVEDGKELKSCSICGETWESGNLYIGGTGLVTCIVENG